MFICRQRDVVVEFTSAPEEVKIIRVLITFELRSNFFYIEV